MADKYYQSGYDFLENFDGFHDFDIVDVEKQFELPYKDKFLINGKIDLIAKDKDGNIILVDYKSKGKWKNKAECEEYSKQLYFYAYAIKQIYGKYPKKMAFYMFRIGHWEWVDFSVKKLHEVMKWAEDTVNLIEEEYEFSPIPEAVNGEFDFYCSNFCSYRSSCKYRNGDITNV